MNEPTYDEINEAAAEAIGAFLKRLGDDLSTGKFVLLVESINSDGMRGLWHATGDQQMPWDTLGLLQYAMEREVENEDDA